jgi:uncharacterized protein (TIGR02284 family)
MRDRNERWLLNHLIELCRDEEQTLRYAAARVKDASTKELLSELASARAKFAADLVPHAQRLGGADAGTGTAMGAFVRRWAVIKDRLVGRTDQRVIAEARHAEDRVLATYTSALDDILPPTVRDLVEGQLAEIRRAHGRVQALTAH